MKLNDKMKRKSLKKHLLSEMRQKRIKKKKKSQKFPN